MSGEKGKVIKMDDITVMVIALVGGSIILSYVLRVVLYKAYDKARNERAMRKNEQRHPEMSRLSDRNNYKKL